jgi:hypothetical protein
VAELESCFFRARNKPQKSVLIQRAIRLPALKLQGINSLAVEDQRQAVARRYNK